MTIPEIIAVYANEADGVEARVARIDRGYSVTLRDVDADEVFGTAVIYPVDALADAHAQAQRCVA